MYICVDTVLLFCRRFVRSLTCIPSLATRWTLFIRLTGINRDDPETSQSSAASCGFRRATWASKSLLHNFQRGTFQNWRRSILTVGGADMRLLRHIRLNCTCRLTPHRFFVYPFLGLGTYDHKFRYLQKGGMWQACRWSTGVGCCS